MKSVLLESFPVTNLFLVASRSVSDSLQAVDTSRESWRCCFFVVVVDAVVVVVVVVEDCSSTEFNSL